MPTLACCKLCERGGRCLLPGIRSGLPAGRRPPDRDSGPYGTCGCSPHSTHASAPISPRLDHHHSPGRREAAREPATTTRAYVNRSVSRYTWPRTNLGHARVRKAKSPAMYAQAGEAIAPRGRNVTTSRRNVPGRRHPRAQGRQVTPEREVPVGMEEDTKASFLLALSLRAALPPCQRNNVRARPTPGAGVIWPATPTRGDKTGYRTARPAVASPLAVYVDAARLYTRRL